MDNYDYLKNKVQKEYTYMTISEQYNIEYGDELGQIENPCIIGIEKIENDYYVILEKYVNLQNCVNWLKINKYMLNLPVFDRLKKIRDKHHWFKLEEDNSIEVNFNTYINIKRTCLSFFRDGGEISGVGYQENSGQYHDYGMLLSFRKNDKFLNIF